MYRGKLSPTVGMFDQQYKRWLFISSCCAKCNEYNIKNYV
uniref:Uncharacterized protein n=1 Tax=Octopus bimaculoides TaxID=37653 RepID=A0A0L8FIT4_OCTBM